MRVPYEPRSKDSFVVELMNWCGAGWSWGWGWGRGRSWGGVGGGEWCCGVWWGVSTELVDEELLMGSVKSEAVEFGG